MAQQFVDGHNRFTRRRMAPDQGGVIQPWRHASNHKASDSSGLGLGFGYFRDHTVTISNQDCLAPGSKPDILTQLVFE
jgi:hypothetical protein